MSRITLQAQTRQILNNIQTNLERTTSLSDQISSGIKVRVPGDTNIGGFVSQTRESISRIDSHLKRMDQASSTLSYQEDVLSQANELLVRAKEIATQGANEAQGAPARQNMAAEIFQLRDQLVSLANSKYQGHYIYHGAIDDTPPYSAATYTNPGTGPESQRYVYDASTGSAVTKNVKVTDDDYVRVNTPGNTVFDEAIQGLEYLGRSLIGYKTTFTAGAPDGGGAAYVQPTEFSVQTDDITAAMQAIDDAIANDIMPERSGIGGRLNRIEFSQSLLGSIKVSAQTTLTSIQAVDLPEAATKLAEANNTLQAAMAVSGRQLNQSIIDYL